MTQSAKSLILPDGEAREPDPGETLTLRPLSLRRPQSVLSPEEQRAAVLRAKARFLREEAEALEAKAKASINT